VSPQKGTQELINLIVVASNDEEGWNVGES